MYIFVEQSKLFFAGVYMALANSIGILKDLPASSFMPIMESFASSEAYLLASARLQFVGFVIVWLAIAAPLLYALFWVVGKIVLGGLKFLERLVVFVTNPFVWLLVIFSVSALLCVGKHLSRFFANGPFVFELEYILSLIFMAVVYRICRVQSWYEQARLATFMSLESVIPTSSFQVGTDSVSNLKLLLRNSEGVGIMDEVPVADCTLKGAVNVFKNVSGNHFPVACATLVATNHEELVDGKLVKLDYFVATNHGFGDDGSLTDKDYLSKFSIGIGNRRLAIHSVETVNGFSETYQDLIMIRVTSAASRLQIKLPKIGNWNEVKTSVVLIARGFGEGIVLQSSGTAVLDINCYVKSGEASVHTYRFNGPTTNGWSGCGVYSGGHLIGMHTTTASRMKPDGTSTGINAGYALAPILKMFFKNKRLGVAKETTDPAYNAESVVFVNEDSMLDMLLEGNDDMEIHKRRIGAGDDWEITVQVNGRRKVYDTEELSSGERFALDLAYASFEKRNQGTGGRAVKPRELAREQQEEELEALYDEEAALPTTDTNPRAVKAAAADLLLVRKNATMIDDEIARLQSKQSADRSSFDEGLIPADQYLQTRNSIETLQSTKIQISKYIVQAEAEYQRVVQLSQKEKTQKARVNRTVKGIRKNKEIKVVPDQRVADMCDRALVSCSSRVVALGKLGRATVAPQDFPSVPQKSLAAVINHPTGSASKAKALTVQSSLTTPQLKQESAPLEKCPTSSDQYLEQRLAMLAHQNQETQKQLQSLISSISNVTVMRSEAACPPGSIDDLELLKGSLKHFERPRQESKEDSLPLIVPKKVAFLSGTQAHCSTLTTEMVDGVVVPKEWTIAPTKSERTFVPRPRTHRPKSEKKAENIAAQAKLVKAKADRLKENWGTEPNARDKALKIRLGLQHLSWEQFYAQKKAYQKKVKEERAWNGVIAQHQKTLAATSKALQGLPTPKKLKSTAKRS
jgi:hypothetical protein